MVDNKIIKNCSLNTATKYGVKAYKLPLKRFGVDLAITRKALNVDKIVHILIDAFE